METSLILLPRRAGSAKVSCVLFTVAPLQCFIPHQLLLRSLSKEANDAVFEVVDHLVRILASDVFEEIKFPSMAQGRVALLSDDSFHFPSTRGPTHGVPSFAALGGN